LGGGGRERAAAWRDKSKSAGGARKQASKQAIKAGCRTKLMGLAQKRAVGREGVDEALIGCDWGKRINKGRPK
jgi:hypothetical protein